MRSLQNASRDARNAINSFRHAPSSPPIARRRSSRAIVARPVAVVARRARSIWQPARSPHRLANSICRRTLSAICQVCSTLSRARSISRAATCAHGRSRPSRAARGRLSLPRGRRSVPRGQLFVDRSALTIKRRTLVAKRGPVFGKIWKRRALFSALANPIDEGLRPNSSGQPIRFAIQVRLIHLGGLS